MNIGALVIHPKDNVAVCLKDFEEGDEVALSSGETIVAVSNIPCGHKIALTKLKSGDEVVKYGESIAPLAMSVSKGGHIHVHNMDI